LILAAASAPVKAGPISINQVVQTLNSYQSADRIPDLRLRQNAGSVLNDVPSGSSRAGDQPATVGSGIADSSTAAPASSDSLLAGVALDSDTPQSNIDVIAQGDLQGSICDCGEIPPTETHRKLWPLLFLAAIPLIFIHWHHHDCESCPPSTPTPTPPCTNCNTTVPEPASLFLFGGGLAALGAGLRRRYSRVKLEKEIATPTGGQ
jgi:hypothetical protein